MTFLQRKNISRLKLIFFGAVFRMVNSFSNLIISLFIVRTQSPGLWGEVVYFILFLDFGFTFINWGNTPFQVREFSRHPEQIKPLLSQSLFSRSFILLLFIVVILISEYKSHVINQLILWALARFIYQSFDSLVQFERKFIYSILMEILGILIVIAPILFLNVPSTLHNIILLYACSFTTKAILALIYYHHFLLFRQQHFNLKLVKKFFLSASPFFLITLSAMLQQRTDLYSVAYFLSKEDTAQYQILLNLLILSQLGASFILSPFSKNIFRLSVHALKKLERKFIQAGIILAFFSILSVHLVIRYLYHFQLSNVLYILGYFYILSFYLYLLKNYELGKSYNQVAVAIYSFLGCFINLILSYFFIPALGLIGALLAGLGAQFFITFLYYKKYFIRHNHAHS